MQQGLCNKDSHLSLQDDIKDILWFLWFERGAGIVSFMTHEPQWWMHVSTSASTSAWNTASHVPHILPSPTKIKKRSWDMSLLFVFCVMFPHSTSSPTQKGTLTLWALLINLEQGRCRCSGTEGILETLRRAGAAELWRKDSRWASLGWGPFKSTRIASFPVWAQATLSEQITCSSKG